MPQLACLLLNTPALSDCYEKNKGETMNKSTLRWVLPGLVAIYALGVTASPAFSKQEGKIKTKGSQKSVTRTINVREAGELPSGIERYSEKKRTLPSGLQKKKDDDGTLTRGLDGGGKKLESTIKDKKALRNSGKL
jgi:hypothetical protein